MKEQKFLAFDFGAESGRAVIGTFGQDSLTLNEVHRFANPVGRMNGRLQWNLLGQWEEIKKGLRATVGVQLSGIGVDTWGVDYGLLDSSGRVLGNPTMYRDTSTDGMVEAACEIVPREQLFKATGVQLMKINTLFQLFAQARQNAAVLAASEKLLLMPDLFNFLLTGVARSEFSIASTTGMMDMSQGVWATGLLERLGIPVRLLPEIVPAGTVLGPLRADVAQECEIAAAPVIAPGCHDTASAIAAVPAEGDMWCYISSGTWSLMGVELDAPIINDKVLHYNYTNEGGYGGSIRLLKNIMGMWLIQECRRHFVKEGYDHSYSDLTRMAARAPAFEAIIDPDHNDFATPGDMPNKIARSCLATGQREPGTRGAYVRACVDSLALKYRQTLEGLEDILGRRIAVIHIVGGGSQNEVLNQLTADACGRPVVAGPVEATAIGNLIVQSIATGSIKSLAEARSLVANSFAVKRYEPRGDPAEIDKAYRFYRQLSNP